jgi:predicted ATP-dependent serine protease
MEGALAGPRVLEHIVDTVLYFEGDTHSTAAWCAPSESLWRGERNWVSFAMTESGPQGVQQPSALVFVQPWHRECRDSCILVTQEGTRPLLVEFQASGRYAHGNRAA